MLGKIQISKVLAPGHHETFAYHLQRSNPREYPAPTLYFLYGSPPDGTRAFSHRAFNMIIGRRQSFPVRAMDVAGRTIEGSVPEQQRCVCSRSKVSRLYLEASDRSYLRLTPCW